MKKFKKVIQGIWFSLKLTFGMKEGAQYVVYKLFLTLLDNLVPLALTIFPGLIINELLADRRITYLIVYVLVLALVPLIKEIVQTFFKQTGHVSGAESQPSPHVRILLIYFENGLRNA